MTYCAFDKYYVLKNIYLIHTSLLKSPTNLAIYFYRKANYRVSDADENRKLVDRNGE